MEIGEITFEEFYTQWMESVQAGNPSTVQLGHRFANKIITHWLDINSDTDDLFYCDGAGDGGIDAAYLSRKESAVNDADVQFAGDIWYLVQSKYGSAFKGTKTLIEESQKVIDTLDEKRAKLSSLSEAVLSRLLNFRQSASEQDKIVLVFASERNLTEEQVRALVDVRAMGRARLGSLFDVEAVSLETLFRRVQETRSKDAKLLHVTLKSALVDSGENLLVGSTPLIALFDFLQSYKKITQDLDQLYERNVRRFLGGRGKVNKQMQATLRERPEQFGLLNNGITITVTDFTRKPNGEYELIEPYIVNGCQTTRTIWEVCHQKLEAGGTGVNDALVEWKTRLLQGVVVTKVVRVGSHGESMLQDITRYTNTQNAVKEKDFLTLTTDFRSWAKLMETEHNIFLEVQRGGWESRKALQKQRPNVHQFERHANAFDLLKVYGAGWLGEAGQAFGRNAAFLPPNGTIFDRITKGDGDNRFGVSDLYAAYRLQQEADEIKFGRNAEKPSRRQSRFLFYLTTIELLKDVLIRIGIEVPSPHDITQAMSALFNVQNVDPVKSLLTNAINLIDEYLTQGTDDSVHNEPSFQNAFNGDLNGFLKWEGIGKSEGNTPGFKSLISDYRKLMGKAKPGQTTEREEITAVIKQAVAK